MFYIFYLSGYYLRLLQLTLLKKIGIESVKRLKLKIWNIPNNTKKHLKKSRRYKQV